MSDQKGGYNGNCDEDKKPAKSRKVEIEAVSALPIEQKETKPDIISDLDQLPVSSAVRRQLRKNSIVTIDQLLDLSESELISLDGIGDKKAQDIVNALESFVNAPPHEQA
ncbi:MAG: helix-hairpin-helix domain-containing protein [Candidatus Dojkabacteria bacterium]|nr:helix-hairpin-helix domain-containing protein [Candidatus Dojkabacteria bacterium]